VIVRKGFLVIKYLIFVVLVASVIPGCGHFNSIQQQAIESYARTADDIDLGMSKSEVEKILNPSQQGLKYHQVKQPDRYIEGSKLVEIIYFRSGWQKDGITTDDEFTPYIFNNNLLVAVGRTTLGGPKTQAQAVLKPDIYRTLISRPTTVYLKQP